MLSVETRDTWTYSLLVTVGASSATYAATASSAYASMLALVAWANNAARPWYGSRTFTWAWSRDSGTGGALLTLSASGTFSVNAGAATVLGMPAAGPVTSVTGTSPALGTWAPKGLIGVSRYYREFDDEGEASATGAIRPGSPSKAAFRPEVSAFGTAQDAARLTYVLGKASNPRRGWIDRLDTGAWVYLTLGEVSRTQSDGTLYGFTFDTRGYA